MLLWVSTELGLWGALLYYSGHSGTQADGGSTTLSLCYLHKRSQDSLQQWKTECVPALKCFHQELTHTISSHTSLAKARQMAMAFVKVWGVECGPPCAWRERQAGCVVTNCYHKTTWMLWSLDHFAGDPSGLDKDDVLAISLCKIST